MTTQPHEGGRRPIDLILAPGFVEGVGALDRDELRRRRQLAEQEEVDLSYARRLLQGRLDLMRAQQARLAAGTVAGPRSDADLARELSDALTDDGPRADHGLGRHLNLDPSRVGEHRRTAEQAVADLGASDPSSLDEQAIAHGIEHLEMIERAVSDSRHRVQLVMDVLTAEVARRYRTGESRVEDVLVVE